VKKRDLVAAVFLMVEIN